MPFFAAPRYTPGRSATEQENPLNTRTLAAEGSAESTAYFGCWLDINQTEHHFPHYPNGDRPYSEAPLAGGPLRSVFESLRNNHLCLVAEIYYEDDSGNFGDTPGTSDNLSQRNLIVENSSNPGSAGSRTIHSTMMIQPSKTPSTDAVISPDGRLRPDELIIWWHTLPKGTEIDLFFRPSMRTAFSTWLPAGPRPILSTRWTTTRSARATAMLRSFPCRAD
ncbi:hypothetical protein [Cribrihabitans marinus]|uniref:hypothetical protein n=1 Tax=Cribrihabitans marinus TaxID=1227549 RepID=UPI0015A52431|nr:hypothetical protein [Cribrihabitans marinus]